jgi:hypothetical protein
MNINVGDILVCKKGGISREACPEHLHKIAVINNDRFKYWSTNYTWRPNIDMFQGFHYIVIDVDQSEIMLAMKNQWDNRDKDQIYPYLPPSEVEFFGFEKKRVNHWEKWFYTKTELRERQLKLLGID